MRWTADQAKVITSRGKNLLVAAAAGSLSLPALRVVFGHCMLIDIVVCVLAV